MTFRLQDEIKQTKPFPRRSSEASLAIVRTAAVIDHALQDVLRPFDLTPTQYNVLRILRGAGEAGLCGREIGERLISQVPDVSRLLDRMDEMGLITRAREEADRRHVTARITVKGQLLVREVEAPLLKLEKSLFGSVSEADLIHLIGVLDEVRNSR